MQPATVIDPDPAEARAEVERAVSLEGADREHALRSVVTRWPHCLDGWAHLADHAYASGDDVTSYAYSRVGYHRGLDRLRASGWRGSGAALWEHESNRGFLRALHGLMRAAAAIGEGVEARRCREFLLELDPDDHFEVRAVRPADLSRRLPDRGGTE